jgi:hypothetical protein
MKISKRAEVILGPRELEAYRLRIEDGLSFSKIGAQMGISESRAFVLYQRAEARVDSSPHWTDGLNVRAANRLNNLNINSREAALEAFQSGKLTPGRERNYGVKSHREVARWLGLPFHETQSRTYATKQCPHCGEVISICITTWLKKVEK